MEGSKPENYNNYLHFSVKSANKKKNYNHVHNIRDFLMVEQIFRSPHVKRSVIISNKPGIYELPHELPNDFRILGKIMKISKLHRIIA